MNTAERAWRAEHAALCRENIRGFIDYLYDISEDYEDVDLSRWNRDSIRDAAHLIELLCERLQELEARPGITIAYKSCWEWMKDNGPPTPRKVERPKRMITLFEE